MMRKRDVAISCFVILWTLVFHYQTFHHWYINPWFSTTFNVELPRIKLLFPPAGWIMFYHVGTSAGFAEIHARDGRKTIVLDPHDILETKAIGYDNIHRNVLIGVLYKERASAFCRYLTRKFPQYQEFAVIYASYPNIITQPDRLERSLAYRCP